MRVKIQHSMASDPPEISFEKIQEFQRTWKYVFHHGASPSANWLMGALRQHCDGKLQLCTLHRERPPWASKLLVKLT